MIYNKKFLLGLLIVTVVGGIIWAAIATIRIPQTPKNPSDQPSENTSSAVLHIKNFSSYPNINVTTKATITDSIDGYISNTPHTSDPIGMVREGSYKETVNGTTSEIVFLVDIASLKRSYKVSYTTDTTEGMRILYILCPSASELIYPPFNCKDDLSEE